MARSQQQTDATDRRNDRIRSLMADDGLVNVEGREGYPTHEDIRVGDVWLTPGDEVVEVTGVHVGASAEETEVTVRFDDRDAIDGDGDIVPFEYTTTAARLMRRMAADGGWTEVPTALYRGSPPNCPRCGAFMSRYPAFRDLAHATCRCGCEMDHRELVEGDHAVEVLV